LKGSIGRTLVELALATNIAVAAWAVEEPETIMTAIAILTERSE
jgi:hypothetical protein